MPATPEQLDAIHAALERFWNAAEGQLSQPHGSSMRHGFDTAVAEIAANIIRHAYPSEGGVLRLRLRCDSGSVQAELSDTGQPFQPRSSEAHRDSRAKSELPEGGWGLNLARDCLDRLDYQRTPDGTNRWLLIKQARLS